MHALGEFCICLSSTFIGRAHFLNDSFSYPSLISERKEGAAVVALFDAVLLSTSAARA